MIEIEKITKTFGKKTAVRELSLTVKPGELFAFLGPNGAGKTTTIKTIAGLLRQDSGAVRICGHDVREDAIAARMNMSYVPEQPYLYEKLTGREFLEFVGRMRRIERTARLARIAEVAEMLSLKDFLDDLGETYSHGMKQRVVIAAALMRVPQALVVDEPMVGLDPRSARAVKDIFRRLARDGAAVFMSTHTLSIAEELADRVGIIHQGNLIACGTIDEVRSVSGGARGLEEMFLRLTAEET